MEKITVASMNCQGLGNMKKRRDVFHYLRQKNYSIYFLQDTHLDPDYDKIYSSEWGYTAFFASNNTASRGVAILFNNNFEFKIKGVYRMQGGNYLMVHVFARNLDIFLINIYGPNRDSPDFYDVLKNHIKNKNISEVIIGGDWNLVLDPNLDCFNYKHINNPKAREKVEEIMEEYSLVDIWRDLNPELKRYTWRRSNPLQQSRLDFYLVSENLCSYSKSVDILPGYRTDHSLITFEMAFGDSKKKKTFWKFNSSLLKDITYVNEINETIEKIIDQYAALPYDRDNLRKVNTKNIQFTISDQLILDVLLMEIRSKTIAYAIKKKKLNTELEIQLEHDILTLEKKIDKDVQDFEMIKEKNKALEELRQKKMEGVLLRSRARWVGEGEKITKYFCALENRNYISKQMTKIITKNGCVLDKTEDIITETKSFFESLYEIKPTIECRIEDCIKNIPTLTEREAQDLEGKITLDEASHVLKKMKNYKSPGTDGFTVEFFKFFWKKRLGELVIRSINEGFEKGELSSTQKEGVIICLPKGDKSRHYLKNWRPISLLNVVYKIASACIAERLKIVLPKLINEDQSGFMANRYIGNNVRLVYDLIHYCNTNEISGLLMCIDFEKAFDSLDWNFMHKTLDTYGFKDDIKNWIKLFLKGIKSTVQVNGQLSTWFYVKRGCRQGDPISPYLFILCAEILAIMIRESESIEGIKTGETKHKISQFADDTQLFQNGSKKSFEHTINILDYFGDISGLKLNVEKTDLVWLGSKINSNIRYMPHLKFRWNPPKFKILGIWFTNDLQDCVKINFEAKHQEIKALYLIWLRRLITPLGRIAVLKSLILSKLVYLWMLLPNPPDLYIMELQKLIFKFVWNRKRDRINRITAIRHIKDGGLGIPDLKCFNSVLKLTWIKRMNNSNHKWKQLLLNTYSNLQDWQTLGPSAFTHQKHDNTFWEHTLKIYEDFRYRVELKSANELLSEPLLYNKNITIDKKCLSFPEFINKNIYFIGNLVNDAGQFYTHQELLTMYNVSINPLTYLGCLRSVKKYIKEKNIKVEGNKMLNFPKSVALLNLPTKGTKLYYDIMIQTKKRPNFCNKWETILDKSINWKKCFKIIQKTQEIKLRWFQIRIIHRIIATNIILKEMGVSNSNLCNLCEKDRDTIKHFLWDCEFVQKFWHDLQECIQNYCYETNLSLNESIIILGTDGNNKTNDVLDYIVICAKYYIYQSKFEKMKPSLEVFRKKLKVKYNLELYNHKLKMTEAEFTANWEQYMPLINIS